MIEKTRHVGDVFDSIVLESIEDKLSGEEWEKSGKPEMWLKIEESTDGKDTVQIFVDLGYGRLKMVVNGKMVNKTSSHILMSKKWVFLDAEYFGIGGLYKKAK